MRRGLEPSSCLPRGLGLSPPRGARREGCQGAGCCVPPGAVQSRPRFQDMAPQVPLCKKAGPVALGCSSGSPGAPCLGAWAPDRQPAPCGPLPSYTAGRAGRTQAGSPTACPGGAGSPPSEPASPRAEGRPVGASAALSGARCPQAPVRGPPCPCLSLPVPASGRGREEAARAAGTGRGHWLQLPGAGLASVPPSQRVQRPSGRLCAGHAAPA